MDQVQAGDWRWFAAAIGVLLVWQVIGAARWYILVRAAGLNPSWPQVLRAFLVGTFANNFLPTSFGGDVARAWMIGRGGQLVRALTSVTVDRLTSFACLVAMAWIAFAADPDAVPGSLVAGLAAVTVGGTALLALLLLVVLRGGGWIASRLPERLLAWAREIRETVWLYVRQPGVFATTFLIGLIVQVLAIANVYLLAKAIGLDLPYALAAVSATLVMVIVLVPISVAGFGVREGGMVLVLGAAGYTATEATVLSFTGVAALVIATLPGAVAMILPGPVPRSGDLSPAEETPPPVTG